MSKQVDERVVSMQFDNKNFERNVQTTLSTLDKLKQSLNLGPDHLNFNFCTVGIQSNDSGSELPPKLDQHLTQK